jgi:group I intron endonuclease
MIIYLATNKITNQKYIGQTIRSLSERQSAHEYAAKKGSKYYFHRAIKKYGIENFIWQIIDTASSFEELNEKEKNTLNYTNLKIVGII